MLVVIPDETVTLHSVSRGKTAEATCNDNVAVLVPDEENEAENVVVPHPLCEGVLR